VLNICRTAVSGCAKGPHCTCYNAQHSIRSVLFVMLFRVQPWLGTWNP